MNETMNITTPAGLVTTDFWITDEELDEVYTYYCVNLTAKYQCLPVANKLWNFVTEIIIHSIIAIFGIIGNILAIIVLQKDRSASSTNIILKALAICDILYLTFAILNNSFRSYIYYYTESDYYNAELAENLAQAVVYFTFPLLSSASYGMLALTVMVTIDRYIAVCKPMVVRKKRNVYIVVTLLSIYVVVYHIPAVFEYTIYRYGGLYRENFHLGYVIKVVRIIQWDPLHRNSYYLFIYKIFMAAILSDLGPIILLIVYNVKLHRALKKMHKRYLNMKRTSRTADIKKQSANSKSLTKTIIIVVTTFTALTMPNLILKVFTTGRQMAIELHHGKAEQVFTPVATNVYYRTIAVLLKSISSSINFIIYILFAKKFRKIFFSTFGKCKWISGDSVSSTCSDNGANNTNNQSASRNKIQPVGNGVSKRGASYCLKELPPSTSA